MLFIYHQITFTYSSTIKRASIQGYHRARFPKNFVFLDSKTSWKKLMTFLTYQLNCFFQIISQPMASIFRNTLAKLLCSSFHSWTYPFPDILSSKTLKLLTSTFWATRNIKDISNGLSRKRLKLLTSTPWLLDTLDLVKHNSLY